MFGAPKPAVGATGFGASAFGAAAAPNANPFAGAATANPAGATGEWQFTTKLLLNFLKSSFETLEPLEPFSQAQSVS